VLFYKDFLQLDAIIFLLLLFNPRGNYCFLFRKQLFFSDLPKPDSVESLGDLLGPNHLLGDFEQF